MAERCAPVALLVEDHADVAEMYATFLTGVGFHVIVATTAADAFAQALAQHPAVIVADLRLPGGADGLQLSTKLRLDRRTTRIPIIMLAGSALPRDRDRALAAGCDVFLTKPCLPSVLADHVKTLLAA
jgi:CheY-like chemotaxis protein